MNHQEYIKQAYNISKASDCARRHVGAVAVQDKKIIAHGCNSTLFREKSCDTIETCIRSNVASGSNLDMCWAIHAEQNMLLSALSQHVSLEGSSIYCTTEPCATCTKLLLGAKVSAIYYSEAYISPFTKELVCGYVQKNPTFIFQQIPLC